MSHVYVTGPPSADARAGLRLRRVEHRVFAGSSMLAREPALRPYLVDLAGRQGLAVREDVLAAGAGHAYPEMARPLIAAVTRPDEPVDLLVLAFGVHDVQPVRMVAPHLSGHCPGAPVAFAVCDQGPSVAFTGLRLVGDHVATGGCRRALLIVAEQSALPYPVPASAPVPDRHAAVALLLEVSPDARPVRVRQHPGVPREAVDAMLSADVAELTGVRTDVTLIVGAGIAPGAGVAGLADALVADGRTAPAGLPYTGPWSRLCDGSGAEPSGGDTGVDAGRRLAVLAHHDDTLGYLSVAALELDTHRAAPAAPPRPPAASPAPAPTLLPAT